MLRIIYKGAVRIERYCNRSAERQISRAGFINLFLKNCAGAQKQIKLNNRHIGFFGSLTSRKAKELSMSSKLFKYSVNL